MSFTMNFMSANKQMNKFFASATTNWNPEQTITQVLMQEQFVQMLLWLHLHYSITATCRRL